LKEAVGQGGFTVIDMGDDTEISDILHESFSFDGCFRKASKGSKKGRGISGVFICEK